MRNIDDNGPALRTVLRDLANTLSPALGDWLEAQVDVVSTSVDRITPRTTTEEIDAAAARMGVRDARPVITEPFHSWILWDGPRHAPALGGMPVPRFVSDIRPFERRKLWLLNGAHSSLAYKGLLRGHETVSDAITRPGVHRPGAGAVGPG
ncbi:mannitol dehydrogenase family protein [Vibrio alginolyticus]